MKEIFHCLDDIKTFDLYQSFQKRFHTEVWVNTNDVLHHYFCRARNWFWLQVIKLYPFDVKLPTQTVPKTFLSIQQGCYFV